MGWGKVPAPWEASYQASRARGLLARFSGPQEEEEEEEEEGLYLGLETRRRVQTNEGAQESENGTP